MKVVLDTCVFASEALLGSGAEQMIDVTSKAKWRIFVSVYLLDELERVLFEKLGFSLRLARQTRDRVKQRAQMINPPASRHKVPGDPADNPILQAALAASADYLVTNDLRLLSLEPYEGLRIVSMSTYYRLLQTEGLLP